MQTHANVAEQRERSTSLRVGFVPGRIPRGQGQAEQVLAISLPGTGHQAGAERIQVARVIGGMRGGQLAAANYSRRPIRDHPKIAIRHGLAHAFGDLLALARQDRAVDGAAEPAQHRSDEAPATELRIKLLQRHILATNPGAGRALRAREDREPVHILGTDENRKLDRETIIRLRGYACVTRKLRSTGPRGRTSIVAIVQRQRKEVGRARRLGFGAGHASNFCCTASRDRRSSCTGVSAVTVAERGHDPNSWNSAEKPPR